MSFFAGARVYALKWAISAALALVLGLPLALAAPRSSDGPLPALQSTQGRRLGVFANGMWFLDRNGDSGFDPGAEISDWGSPSNIPVVGDWNGDGAAELAVFAGGVWFIDRNGDGALDASEIKGWGVAGWTPVVGDWNGDGVTKVGAVTPDSTWFLDVNGDFAFDPATEIFGWGSPGDIPVPADWNGDGRTELAVYSNGVWFIDYNGDRAWNPATEIKGWGVAGWKPVVGDWNGDGRTDLGVVTPDSTWFLDANGDFAFDATTEIVGWGSPGDVPVPADWNSDGRDEIAVFSNGVWFIDYNGNRAWDPATEVKGWGSAGDTPVVGRWAPLRTSDFQIYPRPGAQDVAIGTRVIVALPEPVDPASVTAASVLVNGSGTIRNLRISPDGRYLSIGPHLAASSQYQVAFQNLRTPDGRTIPPTVTSFTTRATYQPATAFGIERWNDYGTDLPVRFAGETPLDPATIGPDSFYLETGNTRERIPLRCRLSSDWKAVDCTLPGALPVATSFSVGASNVQTTDGNYLSLNYQSFRTGFYKDNGQAPRVTRFEPHDGATNVLVRAERRIEFSEQIALHFPPADIRVTQDGQPFPVEPRFNSDDRRVVSVIPVGSAEWAPSSTYKITVHQAYDAAGTPLANAGASTTFTTSGSTDQIYPPSGGLRPRGSVPLNTIFVIDLERPAEPATFTTDAVTIRGPLSPIPITAVLETPTRIRVTPVSPLPPNTRFSIELGGGLTDQYHLPFGMSEEVWTADRVVDQPARVVLVNPIDGATGVVPPYNAIKLLFSGPVLSLDGGIRIERADGTGTPIRLSDARSFGRDLYVSDQYYLSLEPSTQYRIIVDNAIDLAGNAVAPFESTFETAAASAPADEIRPTIVSSTPASGAVDVSLTPTITIELSELVDASTVLWTSLTSSIPTPVDTTLLPDGRTLRIVPREPLLPGRQYYVGLTSLTDFAGNRCSCALFFTTVPGAPDTTPPQILSITPPDGVVVEAARSGSSSSHGLVTVEVEFSEPMESHTLRNHIYVGSNGSQASSGAFLSSDGRRASFSVSIREEQGDLPVSIVFGSQISDLYGNTLGADRRHSFTIRELPDSPSDEYPRVLQVRPSEGATRIPADSPITILTNQPVAAGSLQGNVLVAENGRLVDATVSTRANDQIIEIRPVRPFAPGASVRVFVLEALLSQESKTFSGPGYSPYFLDRSYQVAGGNLPFEVSATSTGSEQPVTIRPRVLFSKPVSPSSVSAVSLRDFSYSPVAGTVRLLAGGRILEFQPDQPLAPNTHYSLSLDGLQSVDGEPLLSGSYFSFQTSSESDVTPPTVKGVSPVHGQTAVPLNARIRIAFSEAIPRAPIEDDVRLEAAGRQWAVELDHYDDRDRRLSITPVEPLLPNTVYTVTFFGARDGSGLSTGQVTWTFTTGGPELDITRPGLLRQQSVYENIPPAAPLVFVFDEPVDLAEFAAGRVMPSSPTNADSEIVGQWTAEDQGRTLVFAPDRPFPVGSRLHVSGIDAAFDLAGNRTPIWTVFTVGFGPDVTPPQVQSTSAPNGATNVSPFARIEITMNEPLDPRTVNASTVRLLDGATPLPVFVDVAPQSHDSQTLETVRVSCACALELARSYTIELDGVADFSGNILTPTYRFRFTTRAAFDFGAPRFTMNLRYQHDIFRTVSAKIRSTEPLDPATVTPETVYYRVAGGVQWPGTVRLEGDDKIIRLTPIDPLPANSSVGIVVTTGVRDAHGNALFYEDSESFTTGSALVDTDPPAILSSNPLDGATGVPVNARPYVSFTERFDPFGGYPSLRLLDPGGQEIDFGEVDLLPNTIYTIDVSASGYDFADLPFAGAQLSFTTGASTVPDVTPPTLLSSVPSAGATGVAVDSSIELIFDEPVGLDFCSLAPVSGPSELELPCEVEYLEPGRVRVIPAATLSPGTLYRVRYSGADSARNPIGEPGVTPEFQFETANVGGDQQGPRVISANPPDGAAGVGMVEVTIQLSEPVRSNSLYGSMQLYLNGEPLPTSIQYAGSNSTFRIYSDSASKSGLVTLLVSSNLLDLAGNPAEPFTTRFEVTLPDRRPPMVSAVRPSAGQTDVAADASFHLFLSKPIDPTTAQAATLVSEDGVLAAGSVEVTANNQVLSFTPSQPYKAGAEIRLFLDLSVLRLASGEAFGSYRYESWYRVTGMPFALISGDPFSPRPRNTEFVFRFNRPINQATVTQTTVRIEDYTGARRAADLSVEDGGRQLRIVPRITLTGNVSHAVVIDQAVKSVTGESLAAGYRFDFWVDPWVTAVAPAAVLSPADGAVGVGVNGRIFVAFSSPIAKATLNESTIRWTDGSQVFGASSVELPRYVAADGPVAATITPQAPLKPLTEYQLIVDGVEDLAGNLVPAVVSSFTTAGAPDLQGPQLVNHSPTTSPVPRNAAFVVEFDEPIDTTSGGFGRRNSNAVESFTRIVSNEGRTTTFLPDNLLTVGGAYGFDPTFRDLSGNPADYSHGGFHPTGYEVSAESATPPLGVELALPADGSTAVPLNTPVVIEFDREIRSTSLDPSLIRIEQGGVAIPVRMEVVGRGKTLEIRAAGLLDPFLPYRWHVDGVLDLAGNPLLAPLTGGFTAGAAVSAERPQLLGMTPAQDATGVSRTTSWVLTFDAPLHPGRLNVSRSYGLPALSWSLSADGKTLTVTPDAILPAQANVSIHVSLYGLTGPYQSLSVRATTN